MKNCPGCSSRLDDSIGLCPSCGYEFQETGSKTIMGFPAVTAADLSDDSESAVDPAKQTLFGFPAQKGFASSFEEPSEAEEDDATSLIPADQLQREFEDDEPQRALVEEIKKPAPKEESGAPNIKAAWGLDEDSEESRTSVMSAKNAFGAPDEPAGFSVRKEDVEFPDHSTLMGMNIADFERKAAAEAAAADPTRSTQFAMPAVQLDQPESKPKPAPTPELDSGPISDEIGAPTQMWNPSDEIPEDATKEQREVLEKIRKGQMPAEAKRSTQESAKPGGQTLPSGPKAGAPPAINVPNLDPADLRARLQAKLKSSSLGELPEPSKSKLEMPAEPQNPPVPAESQPEPEPQKDLSSQGVLGKGTYVVSRPKEEAPVQIPDKAPIAKLQLAPTQSEQPEPAAKLPARGETPRAGVVFSPEDEEDFAFADTSVVPSNLLEGLSSEPARVDGRPTDLFQQIEEEPVQPQPIQVQPTQPAQEPGRPLFPTPGPAPETQGAVEPALPPRDVQITPSPQPQTQPEHSSLVQPTAQSQVDYGPVLLQRIPAVFGALLLLISLVFGVVSGGAVVLFASAVFGVLGIASLANTFSGPPTSLRRVVWAAIGIVGCGFGLVTLFLDLVPVSVGFPAFCGGFALFLASIIRTLYDKLPIQ